MLSKARMLMMSVVLVSVAIWLLGCGSEPKVEVTKVESFKPTSEARSQHPQLSEDKVDEIYNGMMTKELVQLCGFPFYAAITIVRHNG